MSKLYDYIEQLCKVRGENVTTLAKNTHIARTCFSELKAGKNRLIPIPTIIQPMVRNIAGGHSDFTFCAPNGKKMDLINFRKQYYYMALKTIGVRPLAPYPRGHRFEPDYLHQAKKPDLLRTSK